MVPHYEQPNNNKKKNTADIQIKEQIKVMKREGGHISWESLMGQLYRTESQAFDKSFWQLTQMSWLYQSRIARAWTDVESFPHDTRTRGILWQRADKHYTEYSRVSITYNWLMKPLMKTPRSDQSVHNHSASDEIVYIWEIVVKCPVFLYRWPY